MVGMWRSKGRCMVGDEWRFGFHLVLSVSCVAGILAMVWPAAVQPPVEAGVSLGFEWAMVIANIAFLGVFLVVCLTCWSSEDLKKDIERNRVLWQKRMWIRDAKRAVGEEG